MSDKSDDTLAQAKSIGRQPVVTRYRIPTVERTYDIFEKHPDGTMLWKETVNGHEAAIAKLREVAAKTTNEVQVLHLPTKSLIATMNAK